MKRRDHLLLVKPGLIPILLSVLFLTLVAVSALLLPGRQPLLAEGDAHPATARTESVDGMEPALAPRQEVSPPVAVITGRGPYVVDDPDAYVYTVRLGEYWIGIARRFGIEYPDLRAANSELWNLRKEIIRPGDQMVIPNRSADEMAEPMAYVVERGDSWYKIANSFGVSYWDLRLDNLRLWQRRGVYIRPGDEMVIKGAQLALAEAQEQTRAAEAAEAAEPAEEAAEIAETAPPAEEATQPAETTEAPVLTPAQPAPVVAPEVPQDATLYTVRPGDSWFSIAAVYGISFMDLRIANQALWAARGQSIRIGDQMVIPPHGSPPPPPEIRLVPVEPGESAGEEEAVEEEAAAEEGILTPAKPEEIIVDEEAAEDQVVDDEAVGEEVVEEEGVDGVEPTPVAPQEAVTPTPLPTDESEEEPTGPMQPETPEASRLRIDLDAPTIIYVVQGGEDWASVAAKIGVTAEALQSANPTLGGRALQEGDQLRLP